MLQLRLGGCFIVMIVFTMGVAAAQKPIQEVPVHIDTVPPPTDVAGLVAKASTVVRVVVTTINAAEVPLTISLPPMRRVTGKAQP